MFASQEDEDSSKIHIRNVRKIAGIAGISEEFIAQMEHQETENVFEGRKNRSERDG